MEDRSRRVCPAEHSGWLVNPLRKLFQNPNKILRDYVRPGMTVVDLGCGPGFFTLPMAEMVGESGKIIAVDIQEAMLDRLKARIDGRDIEKRIVLHRAEERRLGLAENVDFALAFYMVHEVPDKDAFFQELRSVMKPGAKLLVIEPNFHVGKQAFEEMVAKAAAAGFVPGEGPRLFFSRSTVLSAGTG